MHIHLVKNKWGMLFWFDSAFHAFGETYESESKREERADLLVNLFKTHLSRNVAHPKLKSLPT